MKDVVIAILSSSVVSTLISSLIAKHSKQTLLEKGLMSVLSSLIRIDCKTAIEKGTIELVELRRINENNEIYHALGGNGYIKTLIQKVNQLPVEE